VHIISLSSWYQEYGTHLSVALVGEPARQVACYASAAGSTFFFT
jgi:hypothetical protein